MALRQVGLRGLAPVRPGMVYGAGTHRIVAHPVQP